MIIDVYVVFLIFRLLEMERLELVFLIVEVYVRSVMELKEWIRMIYGRGMVFRVWYGYV